MHNQPHPKKQLLIIALGIVIALIISLNLMGAEQSLMQTISSMQVEPELSKQEVLTGTPDRLYQIKVVLNTIF